MGRTRVSVSPSRARLLYGFVFPVHSFNSQVSARFAPVHNKVSLLVTLNQRASGACIMCSGARHHTSAPHRHPAGLGAKHQNTTEVFETTSVCPVVWPRFGAPRVTARDQRVPPAHPRTDGTCGCASRRSGIRARGTGTRAATKSL